MRFTKIFFSLLFFVPCAVVNAQYKVLPFVQISPYLGYERSHLDWSIAGTPQGINPNVLSELIWKDIASEKVGMQAKINFYKGFFVAGEISKSRSLNGFANDSDYSLDNRQRLPSDFNENYLSNQGKTFSYQYALGYEKKLGKSFKLGGQVGRMYREQLFYLFDFELDNLTVAQQRSSYHPFWRGWQGKFSVHFEKNKWDIGIGQSYQFLDYYAKADWVLIQNFAHPVSFEHMANSDGWLSEAMIAYEIYPKIKLFGQTQFSWINSAIGIDRLHRSNGSSVDTRLNGVNYKFYNVQLGLNLGFL